MSGQSSRTQTEVSGSAPGVPPAIARDEFERLGRRVVEMIAGHLADLPEGPVHRAGLAVDRLPPLRAARLDRRRDRAGCPQHGHQRGA